MSDDPIPAKQAIKRTRHRGYDLIWHQSGDVSVARGDWIVSTEDSLQAAIAQVDWIHDHLTLVDGQYGVPAASRICPVFRYLTGAGA